MKRFFIVLAVCSLLASAVSCEYDAPNIKFVQHEHTLKGASP